MILAKSASQAMAVAREDSRVNYVKCVLMLAIIPQKYHSNTTIYLNRTHNPLGAGGLSD